MNGENGDALSPLAIVEICAITALQKEEYPALQLSCKVSSFRNGLVPQLNCNRQLLALHSLFTCPGCIIFPHKRQERILTVLLTVIRSVL